MSVIVLVVGEGGRCVVRPEKHRFHAGAPAVSRGWIEAEDRPLGPGRRGSDGRAKREGAQ